MTPGRLHTRVFAESLNAQLPTSDNEVAITVVPHPIELIAALAHAVAIDLEEMRDSLAAPDPAEVES